MDEFPPFARIAALRQARGETLEVFGAAIGVASKGRTSEIERGIRAPTPEQALAIERLSGGDIDAGELNEVVRLARHGLPDTAKTAETSTGQINDLSGGVA